MIGGYIVRLDKRIGDYISGAEEDRQSVHKRADELVNILSDKMQSMGLLTAAGIYQSDQNP
jgi:hypothetical protein